VEILSDYVTSGMPNNCISHIRLH